MTARPCIERLPDGRGCPEYAEPGGSRCAGHEAEHERNRRTPSQRVTETQRWRKLRRHLIATRPHVCGICGKRILHERDIEADHVVEVVNGGRPYDPANVQLTHKRCNRAKRARAIRRPSPAGRGYRPPWTLGED
ncbi:HNH endonuclease [Conexibacter arvalis]|uniref:5-methylcytosine-specific restriction endonuclease McrA n=1 Tax=Conexibacter arvalis TaxID=912552 RepID=A0A840IFQ0_9ACTN|nr:HNH endonuclease [Conexibacter arvalis]MBB4663165.1 5-methylcytosine-specific restriction endonuclease McrA [Conexibacter arvalis]